MNKKLDKIKLTERDKKIIESNQHICTESHGKDCINVYLNEQNKNLN